MGNDEEAKSFLLLLAAADLIFRHTKLDFCGQEVRTSVFTHLEVVFQVSKGEAMDSWGAENPMKISKTRR